MTYDYDVIIVGGGLVGVSLALALEHTPLRVAIIEARSETERLQSDYGHRALALSRGTYQILERLSVWPVVSPHAMPIRHIHVSERGCFGKTRLHANDFGVDALGYVVLAHYLEVALLSRLRSVSTCQYLCPAHLMGFQAGSAGICVTLKHAGVDLNLTARLLVAADGGNSSVRRLLDIPLRQDEYGQTAIVTEVSTESANLQTAFERFTSSGPLAMLPLSDHSSSVVWTLPHAEAEILLNEDESVFVDQLQTAFGYWLGRLLLIDSPRYFPLSLILTEQMVDDRVVFIGNALHQVHPVAGQGFNLGLRDAAVLAEHLTTCLAFGEDPGHADCLSGFAATRKRDLDSVVQFTDGLVRMFTGSSPALGLARSVGMTVLDCLPTAKGFFARYAMGYGVRV
ncbi:MAG: 2-octaprenyl-6-methoxyphenyl hydroxylase [Methylococcaceae bacterium]